MGVNLESLKSACRQYEHTLNVRYDDRPGNSVVLLREGLARVEAGKSLSEAQKQLLLEAIEGQVFFVKRDQRQGLDSEESLPLLEALARSREGLEEWPVLSPLSAAADIPVPAPTRHVIDIDR